MNDSNHPMNGQERFTDGLELRWVIGDDQHAPAKVYDNHQRVLYSGTYAGALCWLRDRGCRPLNRRGQ